jgi:serine/threonine-protein kinase
MALLRCRSEFELRTADIRLNVGESVQIGKLKIQTDASALMLPQFYKDETASQLCPRLVL